MPTIGGYPGKILFIEEPELLITECYGSMTAEVGGSLGPIEGVLEDEGTRKYIRENFGEDGLARVETEVRKLLAAR